MMLFVFVSQEEMEKEKKRKEEEEKKQRAEDDEKKQLAAFLLTCLSHWERLWIACCERRHKSNHIT